MTISISGNSTITNRVTFSNVPGDGPGPGGGGGGGGPGCVGTDFDATSDGTQHIGEFLYAFSLSADYAGWEPYENGWFSGSPNLIADGLAGNKTMTITRIVGNLDNYDKFQVSNGCYKADLSQAIIDVTADDWAGEGVTLTVSPSTVNGILMYAFENSFELNSFITNRLGTGPDLLDFYIEATIAEVGNISAIVNYNSN